MDGEGRLEKWKRKRLGEKKNKTNGREEERLRVGGKDRERKTWTPCRCIFF